MIVHVGAWQAWTYWWWRGPTSDIRMTGHRAEMGIDVAMRLTDARAEAKAQGDYARADALRDALLAGGWKLSDRNGPPR